MSIFKRQAADTMSESLFPSLFTFPLSIKRGRIRDYKYSIAFVLILGVIGLLAPLIANDNPLIVKYAGQWYFPVFHESMNVTDAQGKKQLISSGEWKNISCDVRILTPIPYSERSMDFENAQSVSPFETQAISSNRYRHWFGTDELGRDVLAGMIHGAFVTVKVGLIAMLVALLLGGLLGISAGFLGDYTVYVSKAALFSRSFFLLMFLYYGVFINWNDVASGMKDSNSSGALSFIITIGIGVFFYFISELATRLLKLLSWFQRQHTFPVDLLVMRVVEIIVSVPPLFLILAVIAVTQPSLTVVSIVAGTLYSAGIAKYFRAEILKVKTLHFIEAANALGYQKTRIIFKHLIPNAAAPVVISLAFGLANMILLESALSFLGIGLPSDTVSWGSLLAGARSSASSWWLAIIPGLAIFATVYSLNRIGEYYILIFSRD